VIREAVGTDKMVSQVFDGPIWIQAKRVIDYFEETIMSAYTVREPSKTGHRMVYNWPRDMFAELATNCILHKEYDKKQYIGIYVYSDHISFINHNRPLPPVTIEDMNCEDEFRDRNYLNPEIKEMFFALDLIESYGSGIRRAKNAMKANGSPELIFEPDNDIDDYTMVTAYINEEFKKIQQEEQGLGSGKEYDKADKKPIKADKKPIKADKKPIKIGFRESDVLEYIKQNGSISNVQARELLNLAESTTKRLLKKMVEDGLLCVEGERKTTRYKIAE
jgi:predicted HTH transcriptional regulator